MTRALTTKNPNSNSPVCARGATTDDARTKRTSPIAPTPMQYSTAMDWLGMRKALKSSLMTRGQSNSELCVISFGHASVGSNENRIVRLEHSVTLCAALFEPLPRFP